MFSSEESILGRTNPVISSLLTVFISTFTNPRFVDLKCVLLPIVVTPLISPQFRHTFFRMLPHLLLLALQVLAVSANTVTYNWEVDWVTASPDGHARPVVGINGQWPCPTISGNFGDRVIVNVKNSLHNETTSIHFHGIYQLGTNEMDGPAMVTQCPIPPGECSLLFIPK